MSCLHVKRRNSIGNGFFKATAFNQKQTDCNSITRMQQRLTKNYNHTYSCFLFYLPYF